MFKRIFKFSVASLVVLVLLVAPAAAKTNRTEYEGVEVCWPPEGGREWVSEEGVLHARGLEGVCWDQMDDPRVTGELLATVNYNFQFADPPVVVHGPMWGKVHLSNAGGYWEGSWVGKRTEHDGYSYLKIVMRGHGDYEGLQVRAEYVREDPNPAAPYQVHGVIMDPGGE